MFLVVNTRIMGYIYTRVTLKWRHVVDTRASKGVCVCGGGGLVSRKYKAYMSSILRKYEVVEL